MNIQDRVVLREILQAMKALGSHLSSARSASRMEHLMCAETEHELAMSAYKRIEKRMNKLIVQ